MSRYRCFAWFTPETLDDVDTRISDVNWSRTHLELAQGHVGLVGEFENDADALEGLHKAFPIEDLDVVRVQNIIGTSDPWPFIQDLLGSAAPVPGKAWVVVDEPNGDTPAPDSGSQQAEPGNASSGSLPKQPDKSATPDVAAANGPQPASEVAASISAGLQALGLQSDLWGFVGEEAKKELAKDVLETLNDERSAYAQSVRWTFAADAELLRNAPDVLRSGLAAKILTSRAGLAQHQLALANEDVALRRQSVALAEQEVELRKKSVLAASVGVEMLGEFLKQLKKWTWLATWAIWILVVSLLFGAGITIFLVWMAWDGKISEWVIPTAIFALALFAISPAVLLLRERPLKGLDEAGWPGSPPAPEQNAGETGQGATPTAASAGQTTTRSTIAFGQTNQPKAFGPLGRLRT